MAKFESSVKQVPYSQDAVYCCISDLQNLERVRDRVPTDKLEGFTFDHDTVSMNVPPVGQISIEIVEREAPKCVKFGSTQSPMPFHLWIQVLPVTSETSKMKVTVDADIPFMLRGMVAGPLQEAVEKIADALAQVPYQ